MGVSSRKKKGELGLGEKRRRSCALPAAAASPTCCQGVHGARSGHSAPVCGRTSWCWCLERNPTTRPPPLSPEPPCTARGLVCPFLLLLGQSVVLKVLQVPWAPGRHPCRPAVGQSTVWGGGRTVPDPSTFLQCGSGSAVSCDASSRKHLSCSGWRRGGLGGSHRCI